MRIQNLVFKGIKQAVIGSCLVDFDDDGIAEVSDETARGVKGIPGFSIIKAVENLPVVQELQEAVRQPHFNKKKFSKKGQ